MLNANRIKYFLKDKINAKKIFYKESYYNIDNNYKTFMYVIKKKFLTNYNIYSKDNIYYSNNQYLQLYKKAQESNINNF
jgi:hypothetical protein